MAIVPINKIGGAVDTAELTAVPGDVLSPEIFIGSGSDENQQGVIPLRGNPAYSLPVNGSQSLPAGHYSGGAVSQAIPTMGAQSIGPGAQMITIPTAGHYMTGNITIRTTKNLIPSVIKKYEVVGGVTGTFEGYVITDPNTLFEYGTFNGVQSVSAFKRLLYDEMGVFSLERDSIQVIVSSNYRQTTVVFNQPINFDNLNTLIIRYESTPTGSGGVGGIGFSIFPNKVTNYIYDNATSSDLKLNPDLGDELLYGGESGSGGDYTKSVSSVSGNAYLYLHFTHADMITKVKLVKFE